MGKPVYSSEEDFTVPEGQQWLKELLHDENVQDLRITFTKSDGTERVMHATLAEGKIPQDKQPKGAGRNVAKEAQPVFDIDIGEWRSFRWDAVKYVEFSV